jgi:hypothetical protein
MDVVRVKNQFQNRFNNKKNNHKSIMMILLTSPSNQDKYFE